MARAPVFPAVQTAIASGNPATINTALAPVAQAIVADPATGLASSSVATLVAVARQADAPVAETPSAFVTLSNLFFSDAQNWFRRVFTATTAQATPDAQGLQRNVENRSRSTSHPGPQALKSPAPGPIPLAQSPAGAGGALRLGWEPVRESIVPAPGPVQAKARLSAQAGRLSKGRNAGMRPEAARPEGRARQGG
jgi:hypothetical protein